jgi:hypothetical protein
VIGVALAAAFAVGNQFGRRAPAPVAAVAVPAKGERTFGLRLERDAQGFAERAQARR